MVLDLSQTQTSNIPFDKISSFHNNSKPETADGMRRFHPQRLLQSKQSSRNIMYKTLSRKRFEAGRFNIFQEESHKNISPEKTL